MPIHFSIGFVTEQTPRRQFETICSTAYIEDVVESVICEVQEVEVLWRRDYGDCK